MIRKSVIGLVHVLKASYRHVIYLPYFRNQFEKIGEKVYLPLRFTISNPENVICGDDIYFGENITILNSLAKCIIKSHVIFGPNVTIITGNHRIDLVGKYISEVQEADKFLNINDNLVNPYDEDVIFEGDNWIGANTTILKGVHIGFGAVVAAGAVVVDDCEPYKVYGGVPAKCISERFNNDQIIVHEASLNNSKLQ